MSQHARRIPPRLGRWPYWQFAIARPEILRVPGFPCAEDNAMAYATDLFQRSLRDPLILADEFLFSPRTLETLRQHLAEADLAPLARHLDDSRVMSLGIYIQLNRLWQ